MKFNRRTLLVIALWAASAVFCHAATVVWTNTAGGNWNNAVNWDPNQVPGINDAVIITNSIVTVSLGGAASAGGITLGANENCGTPTVLSLNGQTLTLNGPLVVGSCGQFTVDSGTLNGTANASVSGTIGWTAGILAGTLTLNADGILSITTANNHDMGNCVLTNNGTVTWVSGTIRGGGNPGTFIYNNGLWDAQSDQLLQDEFGGGGVVYNNSSTFRKSGGASEFASATIFGGGVVFNQLGGMIDVQNGTNGLELALQGGGTFSGGYVTTNQYGLTVLSVGNFNVNGTLTGTNTWQDAGNLVGTNVINGELTWVAGTWNYAVVTIAPGSRVIVAGGGGVNDMEDTTVTNNGTVTWVSGTIRGGGNPGTFIYNNGLWDAQSDQLLQDEFGGGGVVYNNSSTFRKSGGASEFASATIFGGGVVFNQLGGMIDVQNGTNGLELALQGGGTFSGGYVTTNQYGLTVLSVGNFNVNGTLTGTNTWQDAGNLVGTNVINGELTWVAGTWNYAVVTIAPGSRVIVAGGGGVNDMEDTTVTNNGTVTWSSGTIRGGANPGTFIYNNGLWDAQSDQLLQDVFGGGGVVFNNSSTFQKSAGTGNTTFGNGVLLNQPSGLVNVMTGNMVLQGSGNFTGGLFTTSATATNYLSAGNFNINGTTLSGNVVENAGNLVGNNVINGVLSWVAGTWNSAVVTIAPSSTVIVAGGSGVNDMEDTIVTNSGTVTWSSGTIRGGANPGTFIYNNGLWDAQSDQLLQDEFGGGGVVFNNSSTFQKSAGTGNTTFGNGVLLNQPSGLVNVMTGNMVLQGSGNFTGGLFTTSATATNYLSAGNFNINGTTLSGNVVENAGNLVGNNVINGVLSWVAGTWNSAVVTIAPSSTVIVAGGGGVNDMEDTIVTNNGTLTWASGTIRGGANPGTFVYNNGLWDAQSDQLLQDEFGGAGVVFNNYSTIQKSAGTGSTTFGDGVLLNQPSGLVNVMTGNMVLQGSGNFTGGLFTTSATATNYLNAGNFNINGTILSGNVVENAGNLVGNNVIKGVLSWVAGTWNSAVVTIAPSSTVIVAGGSGVNDMEDTTVTNNGTVTWASGTIRGGANPGTFVYNNGLWDAQSDQLLQDEFGGAGVQFNNNGTFNKSETSGTTSFSSGVAFANSGVLAALSGTIALNGGLSQNHGTIRFGLASTATFGQVSVAGALPLNGTLALKLLGGYAPALGDSFTPLNSSADSSQFENLNLTTLPSGDAWQVAYNPASVNLKVVAFSAPNSQITGSVKDAPTHGVPNISVFAFNTNNPSTYMSTTTDADGLYTLNVTNANWMVGLSDLTANGYNPVPDQQTTTSVAQPIQEVDFVIQAIGATTPAAVTTIASPLTSTSATLIGTVSPNGEAVTVFFEYGTSALDHFSPTNTVTSALNSIQPVQIPVAGLSPGTQYQFQLVAENSIGTSDGGIKTFTTLGTAPVVVTLPATNVSATNATVNGSVNPGGLVTTYYYEYGTDTNYGSFTGTNSLPAGNGTMPVTSTLFQPAACHRVSLPTCGGQRYWRDARW